MKILLVEDDESSVALLTKSLSAHHYVVDVVRDGEAGWTYGSTFEYDLIILDVILPKIDGLCLCQRFRAEGYTTPILLLTAQDGSPAKVRGLDAGADDYVVKPFDTAELIARIRALMRRRSANPFPLLTWGELVLNPSTCEVTYDGQPLLLTTKEYDLLELLVRDSQHVFSTDEILDRLWSSEEFPAEATVRSHIRRLRNKLMTIGAPPDFITTLHGRGYYLKLPEATQPAPVDAPIDLPSQDLNPEQPDRPAAVQAKPPQFELFQSEQDLQYLAFLNETWARTKPQKLGQVMVLSQAVAALQVGSLDRQQQDQAKQVAHKLAGSLGMLGLTRVMELAHQIEQLLDDCPLPDNLAVLPPPQASLLNKLVTDLQQEMSRTTSIQSVHLPPRSLPLLLLVDQTPVSNQLAAVAAERGIRIAIVPTLEAAGDWLTFNDANILLVRAAASIGAAKTGRQAYTAFLESLQALAQAHPALPILVVGDRAELSERLEVVRRGGQLFLEDSATPAQLLDCVRQLLDQVDLEKKVMIVDDDQDWLRTLPRLLKPWGFKITTLADPQQFWTVLRTVGPDVLVLDINMPQVNGLELCQVLRSDPNWQRLPVLFLSVQTDFKTQNQAFSVGADDYLCKPVMGEDLANRILNRLRRTRSWAS